MTVEVVSDRYVPTAVGYRTKTDSDARMSEAIISELWLASAFALEEFVRFLANRVVEIMEFAMRSAASAASDTDTNISTKVNPRFFIP